MFFDRQVLCSIRMQSESPSLSYRAGLHSRRRAQERSRLAVVPTLQHAPPSPGHTLTASSTPARLVRSGRRSEGSPLSGAVQSRHNLVSGRPMDPNHDAVMRIGSEAPKRRTILSVGMKAKGLIGIPPPRTVIGAPSQAYGQGRNCRGAVSIFRSLCRTQNDAVGYNALPHQPPQGDQKFTRQGHNQGLASTASVLGANSIPLR